MTVDDALRESVAGAAEGRITVPVDLQGFPGITHGGAVAALFHRLALPRPPVRLRLTLPRGVPVATPLRLTSGSSDREAHLALTLGERRLAEAAILRDPGPEPAAPDRPAPSEPGSHRPLPRTATCLACGTANPLGTRVAFAFDDEFVSGTYRPLLHYRGRRGEAHPALAPILLDELGWWLGAVHLSECGVTTDLDLVIWRPIPWGPLTVEGARRDTRGDGDPRGRFVRASGILRSPEGEVLATATARFAGSPAYTRRLLGPFLDVTDLATLRLVFPRAGQARGAD